MTSREIKTPSFSTQFGWIILIIVSLLLTFAGLGWTFGLPEMALENISERTTLPPEDFKVGAPSAFDVITLIARGYGTGYTSLGLMSLLLSIEGFRKRPRWAWNAMWVLAAAYLAIATTFTGAGGVSPSSLGLYGLGVVTAAGLVLSRKGTS